MSSNQPPASAGVVRGLHPAKQAAIRQWTADPCGPLTESDEGTESYFEALEQGRSDYAPWMTAALPYDRCAGLRVLDVGCGQGIDLARYARGGAVATGIDLTSHHAELARTHLRVMGLPGDVVNGDAEQLPFDDASFDLVSSNGVLHHTPDIERALREIKRVLRPGGQTVIIVYNRRSIHYWFHLLLVEGLLRGGLLRQRSVAGLLSATVERTSIGARPLVHVYSPRELAGLLVRCGFGGVEVQVRHLDPRDTFPARVAAKCPRALSALERRWGWYVVGYGRS